jgi:hypothetical protein
MENSTLALDHPASPSVPEAEQRVRLHGREIRVALTRAARHATAGLVEPLVVEMELFFSCLVRKQVLVKPLADTTLPREELVPLGGPLLLGFRPVVSEQCRIADLGDEAPPLKTMPVTKPAAYIPHWLRLDFRKGQWLGEFGYRS